MPNADYDRDGDAVIDDSGKHNRGSRYRMPRLDSHGTEHNNRTWDHGAVPLTVTRTSIQEQYDLRDQDWTNMPVDGVTPRIVAPVNPGKFGGGVPVPKLQAGQLLAAPYQDTSTGIVGSGVVNGGTAGVAAGQMNTTFSATGTDA